MVRLARASGDLWVEGFLTLVVALAWLRRGEAFPLPPLELLDPFLREVAEAYPFADGWEGLLLRYPFLAAPTLFAPPLPRLRRALGAFQVLVDGRPVRFRREKARLLLALLAARDFAKEDLLEALEASPGEFRVLWWEVVNALEPGRPKGAPPYFLKTRPYGLHLEAPELYLDLLDPQAPLALPFADLDHPVLEERRWEYLQKRRRALLQSPDPEGWLALLRLDPLDEEAFARLRASPLAAEAEGLRRAALRELGL
jgi:LuxR family maltose regulon positive regulatory protein